MADLTIELTGAERSGGSDDEHELALFTDRGAIPCRYHPVQAGDAAILWLFGAGGGLNGPAGGVYRRLGQQLRTSAIASLELAYRRPPLIDECIADALVGCAWLRQQGKRRMILVGHSFGGAVALEAAARVEDVIAVAALSSQTAGIGDLMGLSPRHLLFVHGTGDDILPDSCSRALHARASEPKELILYPGCGHGLDECRDQLDADLTRWIGERVLVGEGLASDRMRGAKRAPIRRAAARGHCQRPPNARIVRPAGEQPCPRARNRTRKRASRRRRR